MPVQIAVIAFYMTFVALIRAIRLRRQEIDFEEDVLVSSTPDAKLLKHRKNYERAKRTIQGTLATSVCAYIICVSWSISAYTHSYTRFCMTYARTNKTVGAYA